MAQIYSVGDGHYLHLQTQFGEDRCTQFGVILVTDQQANKQTHRQDQLQYTALLSLLHSVTTLTTVKVSPILEMRVPELILVLVR